MAAEFLHVMWAAVVFFLGYRNHKLMKMLKGINTLPPVSRTFEHLTLPPALAPEIPPDFCINTNDAASIIGECFAPLANNTEEYLVEVVQAPLRSTWTNIPVIVLLFLILAYIFYIDWITPKLDGSDQKHEDKVCQKCVALTAFGLEQKNKVRALIDGFGWELELVRQTHYDAMNAQKDRFSIRLQQQEQSFGLQLSELQQQHQMEIAMRDQQHKVQTDDLTTNLNQARRESQVLRTQNSDLNTRLNSATQAQAQAAQIRNSVFSDRARAATAEHEREQAARAAGQRTTSRTTTTTARERDLQQQIEALRDQITPLQTQLADSNAQLADVNTQLKQQIVQLRDVKTQLDQKEDQLTNAHARLVQTQNILDITKDALREAKAEDGEDKEEETEQTLNNDDNEAPDFTFQDPNESSDDGDGGNNGDKSDGAGAEEPTQDSHDQGHSNGESQDSRLQPSNDTVADSSDVAIVTSAAGTQANTLPAIAQPTTLTTLTESPQLNPAAHTFMPPADTAQVEVAAGARGSSVSRSERGLRIPDQLPIVDEHGLEFPRFARTVESIPYDPNNTRRLNRLYQYNRGEMFKYNAARKKYEADFNINPKTNLVFAKIQPDDTEEQLIFHQREHPQQPPIVFTFEEFMLKRNLLQNNNIQPHVFTPAGPRADAMIAPPPPYAPWAPARMRLSRVQGSGQGSITYPIFTGYNTQLHQPSPSPRSSFGQQGGFTGQASSYDFQFGGNNPSQNNTAHSFQFGSQQSPGQAPGGVLGTNVQSPLVRSMERPVHEQHSQYPANPNNFVPPVQQAAPQIAPSPIVQRTASLPGAQARYDFNGVVREYLESNGQTPSSPARQLPAGPNRRAPQGRGDRRNNSAS